MGSWSSWWWAIWLKTLITVKPATSPPIPLEYKIHLFINSMHVTHTSDGQNEATYLERALRRGLRPKIDEHLAWYDKYLQFVEISSRNSLMFMIAWWFLCGSLTYHALSFVSLSRSLGVCGGAVGGAQSANQRAVLNNRWNWLKKEDAI